MNIHTPVFEAGKLYASYTSRLEKLNIFTLYDFLFHIPFRYEDFSLISPIANVQAGEKVTIQGEVVEVKNIFTKHAKKIQKAVIKDETGEIEAIWFNQPFIPKVLHAGDRISMSGRIGTFTNKVVLETPEYESLGADNHTIHTGRLVPVYPETHGVSSKWLRRQVFKLLQTNHQEIHDFLPDELRKKHAYPTLFEALQTIHFPNTFADITKAKERLAYDELLLLQLNSLKRKKDWQQILRGHAFSIDKHQQAIESFWNSLPFTLTNAQRNAVHEIFQDLASEKPMNRLLEGDVGSGKTVVAAIAMYVAYLNGFQSVLMAPTEILAQQHYATISKLLAPLHVTVGLATGSTKHYETRSKEQGKKTPHDSTFMILDSHILVGTHAVLSKNINFDKLGLVVIDEQQRFGVEQRAIIREKGKNPHLLTMTATPIPRTVALTMYGDLDLSVLSEMPKGRKEIKTWLVPEEKRNGAYDWIRKQITETDSQVFIICPFIEESENMQTIKAATKEFERLQKEVFPDLKLGLLHGKMKAKEKDAVLQAFKNKQFAILVATPVVEVGIDIPNATVIMIEAAERFGLAQLHQLRGRVGRGDKQSYCLLFTDSKNDQTRNRLQAMETSHSGAELAELDLKLRGPGDIYGTLQHGRYHLKVATFSDFILIEKTKNDAASLFTKIDQYPILLQKLTALADKNVSPD